VDIIEMIALNNAGFSSIISSKQNIFRAKLTITNIRCCYVLCFLTCEG